MELTKAIHELEQHCGSCKYGAALKALQALNTEAAPEPVTVTISEPVQQKSQAKPKGRECKECHSLESKGVAFPKTGRVCKACLAKYQREWYPKNRAAKTQPAVETTPVPAQSEPVTVTRTTAERFHCEPCHAIFTTRQSFEGHNCIARTA